MVIPDHAGVRRGLRQAYNAQATVTMGSLLIVGAHVTQNANDKQEMEPALVELAKLPETLGAAERMTADNGYCSAHNVEILVNQGIEPVIAVGRQSHHEALAERLAPVRTPRPTPMRWARCSTGSKRRRARRSTPAENHFGTGVRGH